MDTKYTYAYSKIRRVSSTKHIPVLSKKLQRLAREGNALDGATGYCGAELGGLPYYTDTPPDQWIRPCAKCIRLWKLNVALARAE